MSLLTATLIADGSSDSLLKPILEWVLAQYLPAGTTVDIRVPEWGRLPLSRPLRTLPEKLLAAQQFFPADLYFIHRDAEKDSTWPLRNQEIDEGVAKVFQQKFPVYARVVPVQMTETWLLHNEDAIRLAAENPSGRMALPLPDVHSLELLKQAKTVLLAILREASGLTGRRLLRFEAHERRRLHRLVDLQQEEGFHALRALPAFQRLEEEVSRAVDLLYSK
ncbi:hypothetical protein [uncultured Hymenobacter sp.]|uniref:hypothetical protein n=1 Tax=uncultured Hymenobacter sp. TaxID=170016 RepID=UPI0035CB6DB6